MVSLALTYLMALSDTTPLHLFLQSFIFSIKLHYSFDQRTMGSFKNVRWCKKRTLESKVINVRSSSKHWMTPGTFHQLNNDQEKNSEVEISVAGFIMPYVAHNWIPLWTALNWQVLIVSTQSQRVVCMLVASHPEKGPLLWDTRGGRDPALHS